MVIKLTVGLFFYRICFMTTVTLFHKWQNPWPYPRLICNHPASQCFPWRLTGALLTLLAEKDAEVTEQKCIRRDSDVSCTEMQQMRSTAPHANLIPHGFGFRSWVSSSPYQITSLLQLIAVICDVNFWWSGKTDALLGYLGLCLFLSLPSLCRLEELWKGIGWFCQRIVT